MIEIIHYNLSSLTSLGFPICFLSYHKDLKSSFKVNIICINSSHIIPCKFSAFHSRQNRTSFSGRKTCRARTEYHTHSSTQLSSDRCLFQVHFLLSLFPTDTSLIESATSQYSMWGEKIKGIVQATYLYSLMVSHATAYTYRVDFHLLQCATYGSVRLPSHNRSCKLCEKIKGTVNLAANHPFYVTLPLYMSI